MLVFWKHYAMQVLFSKHQMKSCSVLNAKQIKMKVFKQVHLVRNIMTSSQNQQNEYSADFAELFTELCKELQNNKYSEYSLAARNWATANGLIVGGGTLENGEPNYMWQDFITREQMVTVLHRFAHM